MATTIVTKSGSGAPTASDLVAGELAVDLTNKRLYTEDSGGTVLELGTNPASNVTFGDNTKAIFGADSDLQIYSDGTTGQIAGNVNVTGSVTADGLTVVAADAALAASIGSNEQRVYITPNGTEISYNASGDAAGSHMFQTGNIDRLNIASNGDLSLYEDTGTTPKFVWDASAESLTLSGTGGLDVTGTVTADGLTVNGDSISFNTTAGDLDINPLGGGSVEIESSGTLGVKVGGTSGFSVTDASDNNIFKAALNGDISFYEDTGTTPKFFWDASAESLGIGTASPSTSLDVVRAGVQPLRLQSTSGTEVAINMVNTGGNVQLEAHSGNFTIDADNVGIGTSSPSSARLQIKGTGTTVSTNAIFAENSVGAGLFAIRDNGEAFILGNAGIGTSSPNTKVELSGARNTSELRLSSTSNDASWTAGDYIGKLSFYSGDQSGAGVGIKGSIATVATSPSGGSTDMVFSVATTSSNEQEAMRLDADGLVFAAVQYTGGFGAQTTSGTESFDDSSNARAGNGHTLLQGSDTGGPGGLAYYHVFNYEYSTKDGTGNMTQLAYGYNTAQAYIRYRFGGTWSSWAALT